MVLQVNGLVNGDVYHVSGDCDVCAWSILIYYARLGCTVFFRTLMITTGYEVRLSTTEKRQQNLSELEILKGFPIIEFSYQDFYLEGVNNNVDSRVGHNEDVTDIGHNVSKEAYEGILLFKRH